MPMYRVTFMYRSEKWGWSETWYRSSDDLSGLAVPISRYLGYRIRFLPLECAVEGVRVSVVGQSRQGAPYPPGQYPIVPGGNTLIIPAQGGMGGITLARGGITTAGASPAWANIRTALQLYVMKSGRRLGTRYIAPIPVLIEGGDKVSILYDQQPTFWERFQGWYTYFTGIDPNSALRTTPTSAGWLVSSIGYTDPAKEKEITSWRLSAGADTDLTFELAAGDAFGGLTTKNRVVIRKSVMRFKGLKSPNGTWRISNIVPPAGGVGQLVTIRFSSTIDFNNITSYGFVRIREVSYIAPDDLKTVRIGPHKRGLPFGVTAGRRSIPRYAP